MKEQIDAKLLRIFVGEGDKHDGRCVYQEIVRRARDFGLAGATVLRGVLGFGAHHRLHTAKVLRLSEDLPVVVEIVDAPEKVDAFLPTLDELVDEGLVTVEPVRVIGYRRT